MPRDLRQATRVPDARRERASGSGKSTHGHPAGPRHLVTGDELAAFERQSHRDARATHMLQAAQLYQGYLAYRQNVEQLATQRRHVDAHLNFLWSQYLQSSDGQAYLQWERRAMRTEALRGLYDQLWQGAWTEAISKLQGPDPTPPKTRVHARRWAPRFALVAAIATVVGFILAVTTGTPVTDEYGEVTREASTAVAAFAWLSFAALVVGVPVSYLLESILREDTRNRELDAFDAVLSDRADERRETFGSEVFIESVQSTSFATDVQWTLRWTAEPGPGGSVADYREWAFTHYPQPGDFPAGYDTLETPRPPHRSWPAEVRDVLAAIVGGPIDQAEPRAGQRITAYADPGLDPNPT